jgi:RHS repeat-associated protein
MLGWEEKKEEKKGRSSIQGPVSDIVSGPYCSLKTKYLTKAEHKPSSAGAVDLRDEFGYDVDGNRIWKSVDADGDGSGSAVVQKFAYDANGNAFIDYHGTITVDARHVFGEGVDQLIAKIDGGGTTWYHTDLIGSVRDLTDGSGALVDHLDYTTFGKLANETGSGSDRYLYTSREYDAELDLQYNRARYYDANTGRWISQDPLGFDAGDSNLYRYVNNQPTVATDPSGLANETHALPNGYTAFMEWFPEKDKGEISIRNRAGDEVERFVWTKKGGLVRPGTHGSGTPIPGISDSNWRKISFRVNYLLEIMVNRSGGAGTWNRNMTPAVVRSGFPKR